MIIIQIICQNIYGSNFKFYIYNKLYTKNRVRLLGIDKKEIIVKKLKGKNY